MTTDSDGCHVGDLYDNRQRRLPCELFLKRKVIYDFSPSIVILQKTSTFFLETTTKITYLRYTFLLTESASDWKFNCQLG